MNKIEALEKTSIYMAKSMKLLLDTKVKDLNDSFASGVGGNGGSPDESIIDLQPSTKTLHYVSKAHNSEIKQEPDYSEIKQEPVKIPQIFYTKETKNGAIIDTGAPLTVCGKSWVKDYLQENDLKKEDLNPRKTKHSFQLGFGEVFESDMKLNIPVTIKNLKGEYHEYVSEAHIISVPIPFLIGEEEMENQGFNLKMKPKTLTIDEKPNFGKIKLGKGPSGHLILENHPKEKIKQTKAKSRPTYTANPFHPTYIAKAKKKEEEMSRYEKVNRLHRITRHKMQDQLKYIYKKAGMSSPGVNKAIEKVIENCETCQKRRKTRPLPTITLPKAKAPNDVVSVDLKFFQDKGQLKPVLWCVDEFSSFIQGAPIKSKEGQVLKESLEKVWINVIGIPSTGIFSDNGSEFDNKEVRELITEVCGRKMIFTPPYSPNSNGKMREIMLQQIRL